MTSKDSRQLTVSIGITLLVYLLFRIVNLAAKKKTRVSKDKGVAISLSISPVHEFSKDVVEEIMLLEGLGIEGDCHAGEEVQHLFRRVKPPYDKNLRQVHLMQSELFDEFKSVDAEGRSHNVKAADLGENSTTRGLDLLGLSEGTRLHFINPGEEESFAGDHAVVNVTGLRNPCWQINKFQKGLQEKCIVRDDDRKIVGRKAGIMSVVEKGGSIKKGAIILAEKPEGEFKALDQV